MSFFLLSVGRFQMVRKRVDRYCK